MAPLVDDVELHVIFKHFRQKPIDRSSARCNPLKYGRAIKLAFERSLDRLHLAADSANAVNQLLLVPNRVRHGDTLAQCLQGCNSKKESSGPTLQLLQRVIHIHIPPISIL